MKRLHTRLAAVLLSILFVGCGPNRVVIRAVPEKTAPLRERQRALKDLTPESGLQTTYYRNGVPVGTNLNWLMLGDGTRVEDPRDLLPAVDDPSPTATYIHSYGTKSDAGKTWSLVGLGGFVLGSVVMLSGLFVPHSYTSSEGLSPLMTGLAVGGGIELLSLIPLYVGLFGSMAAGADRVSAFQTYPKDLQRRLALEEDAPAEDGSGKHLPDVVSAPGDVPWRVALLPGR